MGDLSRNLSRSEFACKCNCGFDTVDFELVFVIQKTVAHFETLVEGPLIVIINSGCRCVEYNEKIQLDANPNYIPYSSKSQHLFGRAADIVIPDIPAKMVYDYLNNHYKNCYGIGRYKTFTHIDTRSGKPDRW